VKRIGRLVYELRDLGEIKEKKHYCTVTGLNSGVGRPDRLVLSYRGVIRVAMRSQGQRAREFRDWAEEVLLRVMMTGEYSSGKAVIPREGESRGLRKGLAIAEISGRLNVPIPLLARLCRFRRMGLTQREASSALALSRNKVQQIERRLREIGIFFETVHTNRRDREIMDNIGDIILGPVVSGALREGGAR